MNDEKFCPDCKKTLSVWSFALSVNSDDMCFPICKVCVSMRHHNQLKNYYRYFPNRRNKGLAEFVRNSCYESVWRGKIHG